MQVIDPGATPRSLTASARRAQIVRAAIETLAELGFAGASFARIADRAALSSTRLISYHFDDKNELMTEVANEVISALSHHVGERMQHESAPPEALETYLRANFEFTASHRTEMKALLAVFLGGGFDYDAAASAQDLSPVEAILRDGQASGAFREFDTGVMAAIVQRCIEGLPLLLESRPDLDPDAYANEVTTMFDLATRNAR